MFLGDDSNEDDHEDLNYLAPSTTPFALQISISQKYNNNNNNNNNSNSNNNNNNNNNGVDASKRRRGNDSRPIPQQGFLDSEHKTRLSFELHPSLLLHNLMIYQDVDSLPTSQMMKTKMTRRKTEGEIL